MSQNVASASYTCTWLDDGNTYTAFLRGGTGDIWQTYRDLSDPSTFTPSWASMNAADEPFIKAVIMCSDTSISDNDLQSMINNTGTKWFVDGQELIFGTDNKSTSPATGSTDVDWGGYFRRLLPGDARAAMGGLSICKDLADKASGESLVITAELALNVGMRVEKIRASYSIRIYKTAGGNSCIADIYCEPTDSFELNDTNDDVVCKARCWQDGKEITTGITKEWAMLENGAWAVKATTDTFTVNRAMVATSQNVLVRIKNAAGDVIATDAQAITDLSDPYIIYPNPDPTDGRLYASDSTAGVTFFPLLCKISADPTAASSAVACQFRFTVMSPAGTVLNTDSSTLHTIVQPTAGSPGTGTGYLVPRSLFEQINFGPTVNIDAVI